MLMQCIIAYETACRDQLSLGIVVLERARSGLHKIRDLTSLLYFQYYGNMKCAESSQITRYADMFAAMGTEARLRIMQLRCRTISTS